MDSSGFHKLKQEENKKLKCDNKTENSLPKDVDGALLAIMPASAPAPANRLCEDELCLIFSNHWILTKDLLSFRQVSKTWRNAATSTLLRRDACYIAFALDMQSVTLRSEDDSARTGSREDSHFYKLCDTRKPLYKLTSLTDLISSSPKFPASDFRIKTALLPASKYSDLSDLMLFFKLHGEKIKTFRPVGIVSPEYLLDIFFTFAPSLECLDLSEATLKPSKQQGESKKKESMSPWGLRTIPIQSLIIGHSSYRDSKPHREIMDLLLSSPSRLSCIKNVKPGTLQDVLQNGKGHLIKSFEYFIPAYRAGFDTSFSIMDQFELAGLKPKLCKLTLALSDLGPNPTYYRDTLPSINAIMESSKETLQELDLRINPKDRRTKLKIPSMKNLTSIALTGTVNTRTAASVRPYYGHGYGNQGPQIIENDAGYGFVFEFEDGVSAAEYFPNLVKIVLNSLNGSIKENLLCLRKFISNKDGSQRDNSCFKKVDTLEMNFLLWPDVADAKLIAETLPNVRSLGIRCKSLKHLHECLWVMCPLVEFIELKGLTSEGFHLTEDRTAFFDTLFTGFSHDLCFQLLTRDFSQQFIDTPESLSRLRVNPSVCDLQNLKEFKFKHSGRMGLVSGVSYVYAFSRMPNTEFNILYNSTELYPRTEGLFEESASDYDAYIEIDCIFDLAENDDQTSEDEFDEGDDDNEEIDEDDEDDDIDEGYEECDIDEISSLDEDDDTVAE